jgi:hypothetical protein
MCWHLILARCKMQQRWTHTKRFFIWESSYCRVKQLWCLGHYHSASYQGPKLHLDCHVKMFGVLFGRLRLQDHLGWRNVLHGLSSSRRANRFWYINHLNPSSYAKVRSKTLRTDPEQNYGARDQTPTWMVSDGSHEQLGPQDGLESTNLQHGKVSSRRISRFWYENRPNPRSYATCRGETSSGCVFIREIRVKILSSEWKHSYPSEGLMTEWKVSNRVKLRSRSRSDMKTD